MVIQEPFEYFSEKDYIKKSKFSQCKNDFHFLFAKKIDTYLATT